VLRMKRTYAIVASVLIIMIFLVGCNVGEAFKARQKIPLSINKTIPKINVTNQTTVKANVTGNITKMNATLNASKINVTIPKLNITRNVTRFNATSNYTNMNAGGNLSNFSSSNVTNNRTNSTK